MSIIYLWTSPIKIHPFPGSPILRFSTPPVQRIRKGPLDHNIRQPRAERSYIGARLAEVIRNRASPKSSVGAAVRGYSTCGHSGHRTAT